MNSNPVFIPRWRTQTLIWIPTFKSLGLRWRTTWQRWRDEFFLLRSCSTAVGWDTQHISVWRLLSFSLFFMALTRLHTHSQNHKVCMCLFSVTAEIKQRLVKAVRNELFLQLYMCEARLDSQTALIIIYKAVNTESPIYISVELVERPFQNSFIISRYAFKVTWSFLLDSVNYILLPNFK